MRRRLVLRGSTTDIDGRVWQHEQGKGAAYTKVHRPVELVWCGEFDRIDEAFWFEKQVQGRSRAKREALIRGDFDALPALSRRGFRPKTGSVDEQGLEP